MSPERVKRFELNRHGRDFVVGDIHGAYDLLRTEMARIEFDTERDRLFSVGDLIDRGPGSELCARLVDEKWFHAARGNHEEILATFVDVSNRHAAGQVGARHQYEIEEWFWRNGGAWAINLYHGWYGEIRSNEYLTELSERLSRLPLAMEIETKGGLVGIIHADMPYVGRYPMEWPTLLEGLEKDLLSPKMLETITWGRDVIEALLSRDAGHIEVTVLGVDRLFSGHTILACPIQFGNRHWIDTGAYDSGNLTVVEL